MNGEQIIEKGFIETHEEMYPGSALAPVIVETFVFAILELIRSCDEASARQQIQRGGVIAKFSVYRALRRMDYPGSAIRMAGKITRRGSQLTEAELSQIFGDTRGVPEPKIHGGFPILVALFCLLIPATAQAGGFPLGEQLAAIDGRGGFPTEFDVTTPAARDTRIVLEMSKHCRVPCQHVKEVILPNFERNGWSIGTGPENLIQIVDVTENQTGPVPVWKLMFHDREMKRLVGADHSAKAIGNWFNEFVDNGRVTDKPNATQATAAQAPTPYSKIAEGLEIAGLKPGQTFIDIGCGDGRALLIAVEQFHASRATGIEIAPQQAEEAQRRVSAAGLSGRITIIEGDATKLAVPKADVAYVYLYPEVLAALKPQLEKFGTVVSYMHQVPGLPMQKRGDFYIWHAGNQPVQSAAQSEWKQVYVRPWQVPGQECGNRSCVMCYGGYEWRRVAATPARLAAFCPSCVR